MTLTGVFAPLPTPFADDDQLDVVRLRAAVAWWVASPLTGFVVLGSNGEAVLMDDDECDRVVDEARALVPRAAAVHRRRRSRVDAGHHPRREAGGGFRRGRRARSHAVIFQVTDDWRCVRASLHGRGRCVAGAGAALQLHGAHRREPVARDGGPACRAPNIVGMKESGSDIAQIADLVASTPRRVQCPRGFGLDVLSRAVRGRLGRHSCAGGAPAGTVRPALRIDAGASATTKRGRCNSG